MQRTYIMGCASVRLLFRLGLSTPNKLPKPGHAAASNLTSVAMTVRQINNFSVAMSVRMANKVSAKHVIHVAISHSVEMCIHSEGYHVGTIQETSQDWSKNFHILQTHLQLQFLNFETKVGQHHQRPHSDELATAS